MEGTSNLDDARDFGYDWQERMQDEGRWQQVRGAIRNTWGKLTDQELEQVRGSWDRLVGTIKEKTGESAEKIERRLQDMLN
jgi:uncharacterized protein YjbJ (UPF0337 family)